jgi:hypothetical protein
MWTGDVMFKKFMLAFVLTIGCILVTATILLGAITADAAREAPTNKAIAVKIATDLAASWNVRSLQPHFVSPAVGNVDYQTAQASLNALKPLGRLLSHAEPTQTDFKLHKTLGVATVRNATVVFIGEFENGRATVTVRLRSDGGAMKLMHIDVSTIGPIKPKLQA